MFSVDVLHDAAEEGEGDGGLDVVVAIDGRCDGFDDPLGD
jgi:hypothetical protein